MLQLKIYFELRWINLIVCKKIRVKKFRNFVWLFNPLMNVNDYFFANRCLVTSDKIMPVATDTFKELM